MDNVKNDAWYIGRILEDLAFIRKHMKNVDQKAFSENEILQDSMMFRLIQISEDTRKLTDGYKDEHSSIPWMAISGLRNRIVHDYGNVDFSIVFDTLKKDIPDLMDSMEKKLQSYGMRLGNTRKDPQGGGAPLPFLCRSGLQALIRHLSFFGNQLFATIVI